MSGNVSGMRIEAAEESKRGTMYRHAAAEGSIKSENKAAGIISTLHVGHA